MPQSQIDDLVSALQDLKKTVKVCPLCFSPFEEEACSICNDQRRDSSLLCVVEKEADLISIEKTRKYRGLYFILGGTIGLRRNKASLRVNELKERIKKSSFKELLIALNPTPEGEATSLLLEREIKEFNLKTTRLGRGLPLGGELEYADEETLSSALEGRK